MIDLDDETPKTDPETLRRLKTWVANACSLDASVTVMITELRCLEPGCPPLETVIAIMVGPGDRWQHKLHKSAAEVSWAEVIHLANLRDRDRGVAGADHATT